MPFAPRALALLTLFALPLPALAQNVITQNTTIRDQLCVGPACVDTESYDAFSATLRLRSFANRIDFIDTDNALPDTDWQLKANDDNGPDNRFMIRDLTAGTTPVSVRGGAPDNSLYVAADGNVGLGTTLPQSPLHLDTTTNSGIRINQTNIPGGGPQAWETFVDTIGRYIIRNVNTTASPVVIDVGVPDSSLFLFTDQAIFNNLSRDYDFVVRSTNFGAPLIFADASTNRVGLGTATPEQVLHIRTTASDTDAFALFDAAGTGSDAAFLLRQQGTIPTTWEFRNQEGLGRLNVGIAGGNTPFEIDDAANNNLLRLGLNGQTDVVSVTGRLLVNNTQLSVPDYVFGDDYALQPLSEVQAFINTNSHLPEVPSEADIKANGVDMTEMQMTLLKKVEELTLYTLEQQELIRRQRDEIARMQNAHGALAAQVATLIAAQ